MTTFTVEEINKGMLIGLVHTVTGRLKVLRGQNYGHGYYLSDATPEDVEEFNRWTRKEG